MVDRVWLVLLSKQLTHVLVEVPYFMGGERSRLIYFHIELHFHLWFGLSTVWVFCGEQFFLFTNSFWVDRFLNFGGVKIKSAMQADNVFQSFTGQLPFSFLFGFKDSQTSEVSVNFVKSMNNFNHFFGLYFTLLEGNPENGFP